MDKEINTFLLNTDNVSGNDIVTLHYPPHELKLPIAFVRMLLIHGQDYVEYYHDSHMIQIEESISTSDSDFDSDFD